MRVHRPGSCRPSPSLHARVGRPWGPRRRPSSWGRKAARSRSRTAAERHDWAGSGQDVAAGVIAGSSTTDAADASAGSSTVDAADASAERRQERGVEHGGHEGRIGHGGREQPLGGATDGTLCRASITRNSCSLERRSRVLPPPPSMAAPAKRVGDELSEKHRGVRHNGGVRLHRPCSWLNGLARTPAKAATIACFPVSAHQISS